MVRGIATYFEKNFSGWKEIRLQGDVVVDGYSLCHELYLYSEADNVHGGDYVSFSKYLERFLNCLIRNKIKPFIVFDGVDAEQTKKETHAKRRKENAERVLSLLQGKRAESPGDYYLPYLARLVMMETVNRILGEDGYFVADGDADANIASFAIARNCPVLSLDSDFYIFPLLGGYIPYTQLTWDESGVKARIYHYKDFARQFQLNDPLLLIMLPAILGDSFIQPLDDAVKKLTKQFRTRAVEAVLKYLARFTTSDECKSDLARMSQSNPLDNIDMAIKTYYSSVEDIPRTGFTTLKYSGRQSIPKFIVDRFRKGKISNFLMDAICRGEVDHRIAMEDMASQWCHLVGLPIREVTYGIICGRRGRVLEQQRAQGRVDEFQQIVVISKIPVQFQSSDIPLFNDQYVGTAESFGEEIFLAASNCTSEFKKVILKEQWFFFIVTRYWYTKAEVQVNKDKLLKAIILSMLRNIKSAGGSSPIAQAASILAPDLTVIHAIAQWQSTYYDLLCLNQLLLEPLPPMGISQVLECSNVAWFFTRVRKSSGGELIAEMGLDDSCKKCYRDIYNETKRP
ncbi:protein asteroid homolog 1-like [Dysidea avara]|uniref:protein asteroid homolog 1-like n=1 Tax=Dysidea avara TaxID=196820 RepID=UPI003319E02B